MSAIGAETRVALTYYRRCRFKTEIEFGTQRILFREVSKSNKVYDCLSIKFFRRNPFLDAPTHLYKRLSSSVRVSVCPSVGILRNAVYRLLGALLKRL